MFFGTYIMEFLAMTTGCSMRRDWLRTHINVAESTGSYVPDAGYALKLYLLMHEPIVFFLQYLELRKKDKGTSLW